MLFARILTSNFIEVSLFEIFKLLFFNCECMQSVSWISYFYYRFQECLIINRFSFIHSHYVFILDSECGYFSFKLDISSVQCGEINWCPLLFSC